MLKIAKTIDLFNQTIAFYYPVPARSGKHHLIRELVIRRVLNNLNEHTAELEDDLKRLITMPPGDKSFKERTPVVHNQLFRHLQIGFGQYIDRLARSIIDYPASRNLKDVLLSIYISKYADNIQYQLIDQYYTNYYSNPRFRSDTHEQVRMSRILADMLDPNNKGE